jgi:glycosyltransferase involved in cell wall biosynthesis
MPPGGRRQRFVRAVLRHLLDAACREHWDPLAEVLDRIEGSKGAVVFLPSIGWNVHLFQRPHHLARAFARDGYVAIFDSTNVEDELYGFVEVEPNLFLFRGPASLLRRLPRPTLWTLAYNYHEAARYPGAAAVVYDWIDDLSVFTDHDAELLRVNHERALGEATVVASVARMLHERTLGRRPDAVYVPNAVDVEHFGADVDAAAPDDPTVSRWRAEGKPIAGYYGALARWFDYDLLEEAARRRPDWNFLLIGPDYDGSLRRAGLLRRPNVAWIGPRPYAALPAYLARFDVAMIPFRLNPITVATSPLKLYEYFAGGRPVVATALPECAAYPEVDIVGSAAELAAALDVARAKGRDPVASARLRAVAASNSWNERVRRVEDALAVSAARVPAAS